MEQREVVKAAFSALDNNKNGIVNYLYFLKSTYPAIDKNIISAKINCLTPAELRNNAIQYFLDNLDPFFPIEHLPPEREFSLNKTQLSRLCKINKLNLNPYCLEWLSSHHPKEHKYRPYYIEDILSLLKFIKDRQNCSTNRATSDPTDFYTADETTELLGITFTYLRELVRAGHIKRYFPNSKAAYRREDVCEIHDKFESGETFAQRFNMTLQKLRGSVDSQLTSEDYLSTPIAVQLYSKNFVARMTNTIFNQDCKPFTRKLAMSLEMLDEYEPSQYFSMTQIALKLEFQKPSIRYYVKSRIISVTARSKHGMWLIAADEVTRFNDKYISAGAAAALLKISPFKIVDFLACHNVHAVEMHSKPYDISRLFLRSDVNRAHRTCISQSPSEHAKSLTRSEACQKLKVSNSTFSSLERAGAFAANSRDYACNSFLEEDIECFGEHYIRLHHISLFLGCGPENALNFLKKFGIEPVSGARTTRSSATYFKVSELSLLELTPAIA
ncbi:hypothetical protein, partial [Pseudomonas sp. 43(2021)]|uniref:hypothetical protein n=1 Tax=Pseudomonas sp. 43(2021) TaxID=2813560 RepID=UPI001A9D9413